MEKDRTQAERGCWESNQKPLAFRSEPKWDMLSNHSPTTLPNLKCCASHYKTSTRITQKIIFDKTQLKFRELFNLLDFIVCNVTMGLIWFANSSFVFVSPDSTHTQKTHHLSLVLHTSFEGASETNKASWFKMNWSLLFVTFQYD